MGSSSPIETLAAATTPAQGKKAFLSGGGEMGTLMRGLDWSATPVGPVEDWPQALRLAVSILLGSGYPMLICWGPTYTMLYNDAYRPVLGKTKHPGALGRSCQQVFAEAWDFIGPLFDRVMTQGQDASTLTDQLFLLDRNNYLEETYFTFSYSPIPDDDGKVGGVFVTALETTERVIEDRRRRTLRELAARTAEARNEEEVYRVAAATLADNRLSIPFAFLYSYHAEERRARLAQASCATDSALCPVSLDCSRPNLWQFDQALAAGVEPCSIELGGSLATLPSTPWSVPPQSATVVPLTLRGQGDPLGFLVAGINPRREFDANYRQFFRTIAEQVATSISSAKAYEQERQRAEALAELDRAKTLFFSNVSHEFRTPLTLMLGPLEDVMPEARERLSPERQQQLEAARRNALRLLKLVNTLLDFSRIEAGRVQAVYEPTDISPLTAEIASVFRSAMEKAGLRFTVECEPLAEPVYVDRDMWEKIVLNLLSNAFKFTFAGEVALGLKAVDGAVELAVRDTGVGIPKSELERVFHRFHRIESARARTHEGTGIGLALVQELVKLHGGAVRVESRPGRGSTFTVSIPRGTAHLPADRIQASRTMASTAVSGETYVDEAQRWLPQESGAVLEEPVLPKLPSLAAVPAAAGVANRELIVLADDNADMREYLSHLLRGQYRVHAVADGEQAVEAARKLQPALLLADVMMPGLDGFEVLRAIRNDPALNGTPVVLLSARAGEESRVEGLQAGADDYLVKPFTARELLARVATHIKMSNLRREAAEREARLRAEAELERHRLQELLEQAPAAIGLMSGPEHRWTYVNEQYVRVTGRNSATDFVGKTLRESLPEIETQVYAKLLDQVYQTGQSYFGREMKAKLNRSKSGQPEEAYFDFVYQPVRNAEGKTEGVLVHAVEVTDKVKAREGIQKSEERLRLAQTAAQIGTWEWDPVQNTQTLSPELHRIFGTSAADPEYACIWASRVDPDDWPRVQQLMEAGHRSGSMAFEYRYHHPEQGQRWFYCKGRRLEGETRIFGVILDITERKQAEESVRESEERFRAIVETTPECVKLVAPDGTLLQMNSAGLAMVGADCADLAVGKNVYDLIAPEDRDAFRQFNERICRGERGSLEFDIVGLKDARRHMETHAAPLRMSDGRIVQLAVTRDITERSRTQEALQESEERYRTVAETASDVIVSIDEQSTILFANSATADVFGYAPGELVGKNLGILMPNYMRHVHEAGLRRYIETGQRHLNWDATELPGLHKNGREIPLEVSFGEYTKGGKQFFTGFARDISERKRAEEALRRSEEQFRGLANAMPQLVWMANPDGWIFWYNQRWYEYTGTTPEQMKGWGWQSVHDPAVLPQVMERWKGSIASGEPFEMTFPLRGADGVFRPFLTRVVPIRDLEGNISRWFGTNTDVSAEVRIQQELRLSQERLHQALTDARQLAAIVESSDDAIISKDLNGIVTSWNACAERMFGYSAQEMVGRPITIIIPSELHDDEQRILATVARGERIEHFETVRVTKGGEHLDVSLSVFPVHDHSGQIVGAAKIARDITQRKKAEEALRTSERLASVGRLAATVAHEINNPLEAVVNLVYLARNSALHPNVKEYLSEAEKELDRVSHITKQTLGFYRDGRSTSPVRVSTLVEELLGVFSTKFNNGIQVRCETRDDPEIIAVPSEIRQLLANLLSNSLDAVGKQGIIRIRLSAARNGKDGLRVTVADSGHGIPTQYRSKLFQPFFTTKEKVGTGLGLWMCKSIVEKHGGTIRVKSNAKVGKSWTAFSVFLPARSQPTPVMEELSRAV